MGSYFLRVFAAADIVCKSFHIKIDGRPEQSAAMVDELRSYLLLHGRDMDHKGNSSEGGARYVADSPQRPKAMASYQPDVEELCAAFNGLGDGDPSSNGPVRFTSASTSSSGAVRGMMARSIRRVLLRCIPCQPEQGKWTKRGTCLDLFLPLILTRTLRPLLVTAFAKLQKLDKKEVDNMV